MFLEDYEVLNRLNYNLGQNVATYKTQLKLSDGIFYHLHSTVNESSTVKKIKERIKLPQHPNLLEFTDMCEDETSCSIHFLSEFCHRGNFSQVIETCKKKNKYLREEFVCKILQQLLSALKTIENFSGNLNLDELFLDEDFNIKLFNLNLTLQKATKYKSIKVNHVAALVFALCTFNKFEKNEQELMKLEALQYSPNFISLLNLMLKDHSYLYKSIDKIMCNAVLLLKSSQWKKDKTFFTITQLDDIPKTLENDPSELYYHKIKLLRIKEIALQSKEEKLMEKEQQLIRREKKLSLMEKQVREKLTKAEVYLKQNRPNPRNSENLDNSCIVNCGDSVIDVKTTQKLDLTNIKPPNFMRSKSERKIRFKGHSPLKEINYNKRKSLRRSVIIPKIDVINQDVVIPEEQVAANSISSGSSGDSSKTLKPSKRLFLGSNELQEPKNLTESEQRTACNYQPIAWTEDNKRYAFEMLRIMNGNVQIDNCNNNVVKHTVL